MIYSLEITSSFIVLSLSLARHSPFQSAGLEILTTTLGAKPLSAANSFALSLLIIPVRTGGKPKVNLSLF